MRKAAVSIAVIIVLTMIVKVCAKQSGKKSITRPGNTTGNTTNLTLNFSTAAVADVNADILGVNTGFTYKETIDQSTDFMSLVKMVRPGILRFPGGTVANYYHPQSPGYGFKYDEVISVKALHPLYVASQDRQENIIENFIRICQQSGSKATFCANLLTGTPEEALLVIRRLKEAGIELLGVELGNEFNLMMYRSPFPNAQSYISKAKLFASAIRQEFPELPIAVIMGDEIYSSKFRTQRGRFQHQWSTELANENFYDAVIVHYYPKCETCDKNTTYLDDYFQGSWNAIAPYKTHYLDTLAGYVQNVFPGKKIWITEWSTGDWQTFNNTCLQGVFTAQFLLSLMDANIKYNNIFEINNFHFLGADGLIYQSNGNMPPLLTAGKYSATSALFSFSFLSDAIRQKQAKLINHELSPVGKFEDLVVRTFLSADSSVRVYYVNSSKNRYTINFSKHPVVYTLEYIQGTYLSSVSGKAYFENKYDPQTMTSMKIDKKTYKGTEFSIEGFAIGYIEFKPIE